MNLFTGTRSRRLWAAVALAAGIVSLQGTGSARAGLTNVQFTLDSVNSAMKLSGVVRGDFFGTGFISDIPLTGQGSGANPPGANAKYQGTVNADIEFNPDTTTATSIKFTSASLNGINGGSYAPGLWDPTAENPTGDPGNMDGNFVTASEPAVYGLRVSTFVNTGVRNLELDSRSLVAAALTGSTFVSNQAFGLEFLQGFNDLDADALGTVDRQVLRDELDLFEIAGPGVVQPSGMPYPGGVVWRVQTGTDGFGNPTFGALANEFTEGALPVRLYDENGAEQAQLFMNASANPSSLVVTPTGGGNVNLALTMDVNSTGSFFLGDFLVRLNFVGQIKATGTAQFVDEMPTLVGDANGDCSVGAADYALWAAQFGQSGEGLSADFDGNGSVGAGDYALWAANFGKTCEPGGAAVPEPATWALGLIGSLALALVGVRRRQG